MSIKNLKIFEGYKNLSTNEKRFVLKRVAVLGGSVLLVSSVFLGSTVLVKSGVKEKLTDDEVIENYLDSNRYKYGVAGLDFYDELKDAKENIDNIPEYVKVSEKLNKLNLKVTEENERFFEDVNFEFVSPDEVYEKIDQMKELHKTRKQNPYEYNKALCELNYLQKEYNRRLYREYSNLETFGLGMSKTIVSDIDGEAKPYNMTITFEDYQHYNKPEFSDSRIDKEDKKYASAVLDDTVQVIRAENPATDEYAATDYNKERNRALLTIYENIIDDSVKAVEKTEKYNGKSK